MKNNKRNGIKLIADFALLIKILILPIHVFVNDQLILKNDKTT